MTGIKSYAIAWCRSRPQADAAVLRKAVAADRLRRVSTQAYELDFERLATVNKRPGKVALTAVMRKLLGTLNAIARDNQPWAHASAGAT